MLITISIVVGTILCFIIGLLCANSWRDWVSALGMVIIIVAVVGVLACVACGIRIITTHANSEGRLAALQAQKEVLEYRLDQKEYLNDNNIGMTELMEDISEYNSQLAKAQHGLRNPWTSWFYADYVDELTPIILGDKN